jgi:hypothetical protein
MKTIEIKISNRDDFEKINSLLSRLKLEKEFEIKEQKYNMDPVTLCSENSLAEDWDSEEDSRWDNIL